MQRILNKFVLDVIIMERVSEWVGGPQWYDPAISMSLPRLVGICMCVCVAYVCVYVDVCVSIYVGRCMKIYMCIYLGR